MPEDKIFADGLVFALPREGAPDFVKGRLGVNVEKFKTFLDAHVKGNGWVDIDLKVGTSGKPYAELNTYVPQKPQSLEEDEGYPDGEDPNLIPF